MIYPGQIGLSGLSALAKRDPRQPIPEDDRPNWNQIAVEPAPTPDLPQGQMTRQRVIDLAPNVSGLSQVGDVTPYEQQAYKPGVLQQRYQQSAEEGPSRHHGFLGRLKDAGIGFLLGGIPGAITGAVAPQIIHNVRHNIGLSQLAQQADQERQGQDQERQGLAQYGGLTGLRYGTDKPTLQRQEFNQRQEQTKIYRDQLEEARQARIAETARAHDETERKNRETAAKNAVQLAAKLRKPVDPNAVKGTALESFAGVVPPADPAELDRTIRTYGQFGVPVPGTLAQGLYSGLAGKAAPHHDPNALTPAQRLAEQREQRIETRQRRQDENAVGKEYEGAVRTAKQSDLALRKAQATLSKHIETLKAAKYSPEQIATDGYVQALQEEIAQHEANSRSAWGEVGGHVDRLESEFGWKASRQNPQYPSAQRPVRRQGGPSGRVTGSVTRQDVTDFAKEQGITYEQALGAFRKEGYQIR